MKTTYRYNRPDTMDSEDYYELKSNFSEEDWLAEAAAENYHRMHDGWEASWPITLVISKEDGTVIGTYEVDRDMEPVFSARKVEK